jgi:hypothetical protein
VIEFALPGKQQLNLVLEGIIESAKLKVVEGEQRDKVLDAASGLTTIEAENAFALSVVESKSIDPVRRISRVRIPSLAPITSRVSSMSPTFAPPGRCLPVN